MENNDIIDIEKIPESPRKESSYKNFPIPEIIYKPKNKIILLPRIKNINNNNYNSNNKNTNNNSIKNYNNKDFDNNNNSNNSIPHSNSNSKSKSTKDKCFSEKKRLNSGKSKRTINNVILHPKIYPNLYSIQNKNKIVKLDNIKSLLNNKKNVGINISESINNCKRKRNNYIHLKQYLPKITITSDKLYNNFRDGLSKLKQQPLEVIVKQNLENDKNTIDNRNNDIFKTTEVIQNIKVGSKFDPDDNTIENEEKNEFNEKLKNYMYNLNNKKKNKSRNLKIKNCYEVLEDMKKKKTYDYERLIEKTSNEARQKKRQIFLIYNNLKKSFEQNDKWNQIN